MIEFVTIALLIVVILFLSSTKKILEEKIETLLRKTEELRKEVRELQSRGFEKEAPKPVAPPIVKPEVKPTEEQPKEQKVWETFVPPVIKAAETKPTPQPVKQSVKPPVQEKRFLESFLEKNPDIEKFIGENLINKIGIAILVLGIGFFVKYAIDQDWINEIGRTAIGILCGGILIGLAHRMRNSFRSFSSVLVGGGLAVLYFTITISYHQYHLFSQTLAFIIMVVVTAFSVILSLTYDRKELAVLAIIGGFASPFMVSTGEGNYVVLFSYLLILNSGMLILAYYKGWHIINIIAYVFTSLIFGGWLYKDVQGKENPPYLGAMVFATLFYLVFFAMNIVNNIKENKKFIAAQISILVANSFLYYSAGMIILDNLDDGAYKGLFTASVAVFNFIFAFLLFRNNKVDKLLVYLLIGLVLTFLSLAAPVQLKGNYITLFWAAEVVLLFWLSQKSKIRLIQAGSILVTVLMIISLAMDWFTYMDYREEPLAIVFNQLFITSLVSIASIVGLIFLVKKEDGPLSIGINASVYKELLRGLLVVVSYISGLLELYYQLNEYIQIEAARNIILGSYNLLSILCLALIVTKRSSEKELKTITTVAAMVGVFLYLTYYNMQVVEVRNEFVLIHDAPLWNYLYHYADTLLAALLLATAFYKVRKAPGFRTTPGRVFIWAASLAIVALLSEELDHAIVMALFNKEYGPYDILTQNHKIGYPILWGLCSLVFMVVGMRKKLKDLRIISLSLFLIIILKLFIFDIKGISEGGKIAAFISLGVLLLIVSFMYQKLKKLLLEDELNNPKEKSE